LHKNKIKEKTEKEHIGKIDIMQPLFVADIKKKGK